jgi:hypothetical protein
MNAAMHCPSLTIFGTFFPSWMLCVLIGIVVAGGAHKLFTVFHLDTELRPALLFYPSIVVGVTALVWLGFYGH